jgi:lactate dehydrogenase-like 2-hydroxyacid dehydrogenase
MPPPKLHVVVTRRLPEPVEARMRELFDVALNAEDRPLAPEEIAAAMAQADVLVPTITDRIDARLLAQAGPRLKLIANYGAGFDHIDVATALRRGIIVSNTPGVLAEDTADMTMALILSVPRRVQEGAQMMQRGEWGGWSPTALLGHRVAGKRLGILGLGPDRPRRRRPRPRLRPPGPLPQPPPPPPRHGGRARRHVVGEPRPDARPRGRALRQRPPHALHLPLMNARRLKLMKSTAYVVNTARGEVIDENALTRMLRAGELAGAGLDVYEHGHDINPRLRELPNVLLLPHMGSATIEGRVEMGEKVIINIKTFADGHRPPDQVVPAML